LGYKSEDVGLNVRAISFQDFNLCGHDPPTSQIDGQTDRQTTCNRKTALCAIVHRAVKTLRATCVGRNGRHSRNDLMSMTNIFFILFTGSNQWDVAYPPPRQPILLETSRCSSPSSSVRISLDSDSGRSISCTVMR